MAELAPSNGTDQAWDQAKAEKGASTPPPSGGDISSAADERARIREMIAGNAKNAAADPRAAFRNPNPAPPAPDFSGPEETKETPAPPPPPQSNGATEAELDLERRILSGDSGERLFNDQLDTKIKIGDREVSLSRLREQEDAFLTRSKWEEDLKQKNEQAEQINRTMIAAAREFRGDPIGSLEKIGVTRAQLLQHMRDQGLYAGEAATPQSKINELPADADDTAKALFHENSALKRIIPQLQEQIGSIRNGIQAKNEEERELQRRQAHLGTLADAGAHVRSLALQMPSMRQSAGKLTPTAELLIRDTVRQLNDRVGTGIEPGEARAKAQEIFAQTARSLGVTPKEDRARSALASKRAPVPTQAGSTVPLAEPGAAGNGRRFNFDDDEQRRSAAANWFEQQGLAAS
jgi:hypothetical protein